MSASSSAILGWASNPFEVWSRSDESSDYRSISLVAIETIQNGIRVSVYVQPRASRTELTGRHGDAIKIRLAAPPVDNAANEELIRFLADLLGVPAGAVEIERGHTSRRKTVRIRGVTAEQAESRLTPSR